MLPLTAIAIEHQRRHIAAMEDKATKRRKKFEKPAHWTNEPLPEPAPPKDDEKLSPTRYGDWVKNGIAVDF